MAQVNLEEALQEFHRLKTENNARNQDYYLLRQAVKGNFRWPKDWPNHIPRIKDNLCSRIVAVQSTYLMGKGFSWNVDRPNSVEFRDAAERTEKILSRLFRLSKADVHFNQAARTGSKLGVSIFKVYKKGKPGAEHACFSYCQPDYFYGVSSGDDVVADYSTVYYSYPIDILEARRRYGDHAYQTEGSGLRSNHYDPLKEREVGGTVGRNRRVPVLEVWTKDAYALVVGGVTVFNGDNPNKWKDTGEGFIPFVVIPNIRNDEDGRGEADIAQARELNEQLNYLVSRKFYVVWRHLYPTLVWEGAPQNYSEILAGTEGGGGAIPVRLGGRLDFLAYDRANPAVVEMEQTLRNAMLESAGLDEVSLSGTVTGSVNTGPAMAAQFIPSLTTVEGKRKEWEHGLQSLSAMLLEIQEQIGDSKALGHAVVNQTIKTQGDFADGELVPLSGKDIGGLRDIVIHWPGVLPKDDAEAARLEMEKAAQGLQSIYTTLEKLGVEYPDDEIARIRQENTDPALKGEKVAEQIRAQTPLIKAQMEQETAMAQQAMAPEGEGFIEPPEEELLAQGDIGARLRELSRRKASLNTEGDELTIDDESMVAPY